MSARIRVGGVAPTWGLQAHGGACLSFLKMLEHRERTYEAHAGMDRLGEPKRLK